MRYLSLVKSEAVPLQAWSDPEGSRKLRFPDFMTTAQYGGKIVNLTVKWGIYTNILTKPKDTPTITKPSMPQISEFGSW